jgi:hypothetical protein
MNLLINWSLFQLPCLLDIVMHVVLALNDQQQVK